MPTTLHYVLQLTRHRRTLTPCGIIAIQVQTSDIMKNYNTNGGMNIFGGDPRYDTRAFHAKQQADTQEYLRRTRSNEKTQFQENLEASRKQRQEELNPPTDSSFSSQSPAFQNESNRLSARAQMLRNNPGMVEDLRDQRARQLYDERMASARARTPEAQQYAAEKKIFKRTGERTGSLLADHLEHQRQERISQPEYVANRAQSLMDAYLQRAQRGGQGTQQYDRAQSRVLNLLQDTLGNLDTTSTEPLDFKTQNIFDLTSGFLRDQQQQQIQSQLSGVLDRPAPQPLTGYYEGPMVQPIQSAQNPKRDQFGQFSGPQNYSSGGMSQQQIMGLMGR